MEIAFISYQENIDTSSPLDKAMFTIVSAIAELEHNIIVERIRAGMANAKARGVRFGPRPKVDSQLCQQISQMRTEGHSIRAIARSLQLAKSTVYQALIRLGLPEKQSRPDLSPP